MKVLNKRVLTIALSAGSLLGAGVMLASADSTPSVTDAAAASNSALPSVTATIDQVVQVASTMTGPEKLKERRQKLRELINPRFDFIKMAQLSLGSNWNELKPEQQTEFTTTFSELLARTYLSKIETVKPGMVKIDTEKLEFPRSLVRTLVTSKGDVFPIEYRLYNQNGNWQVYDVVIENIGLVANYRNEFAGIMRKEGAAGLLQRLKEKNVTAESAGAK